MLVQIISIMLRNTFTTDELVERVTLLRMYYSAVLFGSKREASLSDVLSGSCSDDTLQALQLWQQQLSEAGLQPITVYEGLDSIEQEIGGLPTVTLSLPIKFSQAHLRTFGEWFRANVQPNILLSVRTDPRMAGGCGVVWDHVFHDLSLKHHIAQHREELIAEFDKQTHGL